MSGFGIPLLVYAKRSGWDSPEAMFLKIQLGPSFRSEDLIGIAQDASRACVQSKNGKAHFGCSEC